MADFYSRENNTNSSDEINSGKGFINNLHSNSIFQSELLNKPALSNEAFQGVVTTLRTPESINTHTFDNHSNTGIIRKVGLQLVYSSLVILLMLYFTFAVFCLSPVVPPVNISVEETFTEHLRQPEPIVVQAAVSPLSVVFRSNKETKKTNGRGSSPTAVSRSAAANLNVAKDKTAVVEAPLKMKGQVNSNTTAKAIFTSTTFTTSTTTFYTKSDSLENPETDGLQELKAAALEQYKPFYLKFGAKWCLPCKIMEQTTFQDPQLKAYLDHHYLGMGVDVDDFDGYNLKQRFQVKSLPTILIFDRNGHELVRFEESLSAKKLLDNLRKYEFSEIRENRAGKRASYGYSTGK